VEVSESGAIQAIRCGRTLVNQVIPGPAENGLFRLIARKLAIGVPVGWANLVGSGIAFSQTSDRSATWYSEPFTGMVARATLSLHPTESAWCWQVELVAPAGSTAEVVDVLLAQDLGIGDEGAVRNSEAFTSQYIDLLPVSDPKLGWVVLARQNLEMSGASFPWLATGCPSGARSFCTDGWQFFGADHRLTGEPAAVRATELPSARLQYECAMAGLQSMSLSVSGDATAKVSFVCRMLANHPAASGPADTGYLHQILPLSWASPAQAGPAPTPPARSLFVAAPWAHGSEPSESDLSIWFPGPRRQEERSKQGTLLSFFCGRSTHVATRAKEATIMRPHGHIIRSGPWRWIDPSHIGLTAYASGVFASQAYLGNQSISRLLPIARDSLSLIRSTGQRIFVSIDGVWCQLGVPSAFAMEPGGITWYYKLKGVVIMAHAWCSPDAACAYLRLGALSGQPLDWIASHSLCLGANEYDWGGTVAIETQEQYAVCVPAPDSFFAKNVPGAAFAIAIGSPNAGTEVTTDGPLFGDGRSRGVPAVCVRARKTGSLTVIMAASEGGKAALASLVSLGRRQAMDASAHSAPPDCPLHLAAPDAAALAPKARDEVVRINEILPWLSHNAAIHFAAPHGLEQHSGAAWGVRDVCQGSIEWLLSIGELELARKSIETVFAQQYADDGSWPQWFMHAPYPTVRQVDSHGDVMFWPVKALCDYVEASNDLDFLKARVGFIDHASLTAAPGDASLLEHCDRVVDLCEKRFVPGTSLVNYGDGDWDDTLRPADHAMRTRMISSWTVALAFHCFRQLSGLYAHIGESARKARLDSILASMRADFTARLMPDSVVAGFVVVEKDGSFRPLLHPHDEITRIRYRLLPMTRSVLAELFTPEQAAQHLDIVHRELLYPDGVRLMSEPAVYQGGCERLFKRADSAANVGREIGLQYVHAHLRYAEVMAKTGDADRLWWALQAVNPVGLERTVPNAAPRQSNVYFSSSDADFDNRPAASQRWGEVKSGTVAVRAGWRLYSSGPGLFLHKVRSCLLGVRTSFGDLVIDPVLPRSLDGLEAEISIDGRPLRIVYRVSRNTSGTHAVTLNGKALTDGRREPNPYRLGGLRFSLADVRKLLSGSKNELVVTL
jgi:1,2-beta-oligoglucan phosphorylase